MKHLHTSLPAIPFIFLLVMVSFLECKSQELLVESVSEGEYTCPPCGCNSDELMFDAVGRCPSCGMNLIHSKEPSEGYDFTNIYPTDVCQWVNDHPDGLLLDVRTKGEYYGKLGHLKNSKLIPIQQFEDRMSEVEAFKDSPVLVYCLVSIRSMRVSQLMVENGFKNVTNMLGGMSEWDTYTNSELPCKAELTVYK